MKAVVLEVRGREAALLMEDGTVRKARGQYSVGQKLDFYEPVRSGPRQWVAAVVVAAILLTGSVGMWINNNYVAYAEVSLDADASIIYALNRRSRVLSVRAANAEAEPVVEALDDAGIRFSTLSDAVTLTLDKLSEAGYLDANTDDYVLASVSADDAAQRETLAAEVETAIAATQAQDATLEYRVERTDRATARAARESGMSAGRYSAWQQSGDEERREDYAEMPVAEFFEEKRQPPEQAMPEAPEAEARPENEERPGTETRPEVEERPEVEAQPENEERPEVEAQPESEERPETEAQPEQQAPEQPEEALQPAPVVEPKAASAPEAQEDRPEDAPEAPGQEEAQQKEEEASEAPEPAKEDQPDEPEQRESEKPEAPQTMTESRPAGSQPKDSARESAPQARESTRSAPSESKGNASRPEGGGGPGGPGR